jgi:hypothetical protein
MTETKPWKGWATVFRLFALFFLVCSLGADESRELDSAIIALLLLFRAELEEMKHAN